MKALLKLITCIPVTIQFVASHYMFLAQIEKDIFNYLLEKHGMKCSEVLSSLHRTSVDFKLLGSCGQSIEAGPTGRMTLVA